MKLRIRGNSLAFQLTPLEVAQLVATGSIEHQVQLGHFPECTLTYRLELSESATRPATAFHNSTLSIYLPATETKNWANTPTVSIYSEENWGLQLTIEKDFSSVDFPLNVNDVDVSIISHGPSPVPYRARLY